MKYFVAAIKRLKNNLHIIKSKIICIINKISRKERIYCEAYTKKTLIGFKKINWGDDINKYFFEYITGNRVVFLPYSKLKDDTIICYSLIGSIIDSFGINNKIVYGSGIRNPNCKIEGKPKRIISVRGPKTREILQKNGILCPKNYGDPALLLPMFYQPKINKKYKYSIIPNEATLLNNNEVVNKLIKEYNCHLINMQKYGDWKTIIDEILQSEYVISESLHGLIVAETYSVPNVWVEFIDHEEFWDFKYMDYYLSIGKNEEKIISMQKNMNIDCVYKKLDNWFKGNIDYDDMINKFPFIIQSKIVRNL